MLLPIAYHTQYIVHNIYSLLLSQCLEGQLALVTTLYYYGPSCNWSGLADTRGYYLSEKPPAQLQPVQLQLTLITVVDYYTELVHCTTIGSYEQSHNTHTIPIVSIKGIIGNHTSVSY